MLWVNIIAPVSDSHETDIGIYLLEAKERSFTFYFS